MKHEPDIIPDPTAKFSREQIREYCGRINAAWQKSVSGIVEAGSLLHELRKGCAHGDWGPLFVGKDAPLKVSMQIAYNLIKIAEHPVLSNIKHALDLPASWSTLYVLTRIPAETLKQLIADGTVNNRLDRKTAETLVMRHASKIRRHGHKHPELPIPLKRDLIKKKPRIGRESREAGPAYDVIEDIAPLIAELEEQSDEIRANDSFRDQVRSFGDRLLAIVEDDPAVILGTQVAKVA
jgi:hypothetical protein